MQSKTIQQSGSVSPNTISNKQALTLQPSILVNSTLRGKQSPNFSIQSQLIKKPITASRRLISTNNAGAPTLAQSYDTNFAQSCEIVQQSLSNLVSDKIQLNMSKQELAKTQTTNKKQHVKVKIDRGMISKKQKSANPRVKSVKRKYSEQYLRS